MKKLGIFICAILLSSAAFSQVETEKKEEVKAVKKEVNVQREVKVTEENGVKTVEVTEVDESGAVRHEVFTGAAAEKKLAELKKEEAKSNAKVTRSESKKKIVKKVEVREEKEEPNKIH